MNKIKPGDFFLYVSMLEKRALEVPSFMKDLPDALPKAPAGAANLAAKASTGFDKAKNLAKGGLLGAGSVALDMGAEALGKSIGNTPNISTSTGSKLLDFGSSGAAGMAAMSPDPFIGGAGKAMMVGKPLATIGGAAAGRGYAAAEQAVSGSNTSVGPGFSSALGNPKNLDGIASRLGVAPEAVKGMSNDQVVDGFNQKRISESKAFSPQAAVAPSQVKLEAEPLDPNSFKAKQLKYHGGR